MIDDECSLRLSVLSLSEAGERTTGATSSSLLRLSLVRLISISFLDVPGHWWALCYSFPVADLQRKFEADRSTA